MGTIRGQNFGTPEASHQSQSGDSPDNSPGSSRGQNVSFLDSEDCLWHENPSEEIITVMGNGTACATLEYNG